MTEAWDPVRTCRRVCTWGIDAHALVFFIRSECGTRAELTL
jgi:hypothetical protein